MFVLGRVHMGTCGIAYFAGPAESPAAACGEPWCWDVPQRRPDVLGRTWLVDEEGAETAGDDGGGEEPGGDDAG